MTSPDAPIDQPRDKDGMTPLHRAIEAGLDEEVRALLARGASVEARTRNGRGVIHLAAKAGMTWLVERALDAGANVGDAETWDKDPPLASAVFGNHLEVARLLLSRGADVNQPCGDRNAPISHVSSGAMAELLIAAGARPDHGNHENRTALHWAGALGYADAIEVLVRHGVNVDVQTNTGFTPLMGAGGSGGTAAGAATLLRLGADVHYMSNYNGTPLYWAAHCGNVAVMRVLLDHGADPNARNTRYPEALGRTPLHEAAEYGEVEAIALLLERGADPSLTTTDGKKPVELASNAATRNAFPKDPAVVARTQEGERIVAELERLGFFCYVPRKQLKAVKARVVDSYVAQRTLAAFGKTATLSQHGRELHTDAEELFEGQMAAALDAMADVLAEAGLTLEGTRDEVDERGHTLVVNGTAYAVREGAARSGWGAAYRRFIEIGNQLLEAAGSSERLWAMGYTGNDASVLLLTPELRDHIAALDLDAKWKPRPPAEITW